MLRLWVLLSLCKLSYEFSILACLIIFSLSQPQETVTTPVPDALTRLRSRPRLHVTGATKPTSAPAANSNNRRHLVSSLLPKRRPLQPAPETKDSEAAEPHDSDGNGFCFKQQSVNSQHMPVHLCS